jgi:hypothetical protein
VICHRQGIWGFEQVLCLHAQVSTRLPSSSAPGSIVHLPQRTFQLCKHVEHAPPDIPEHVITDRICCSVVDHCSSVGCFMLQAAQDYILLLIQHNDWFAVGSITRGALCMAGARHAGCVAWNSTPVPPQVNATPCVAVMPWIADHHCLSASAA